MRTCTPCASKKTKKCVKSSAKRRCFCVRVKNMNVLYQAVDHCNLNCIGCDHGAPLAEPWCVDISQFETDLRDLVNLVGVDELVIYGGEPLLHPHLPQLLVTAANICGNIDIFVRTNGIKLEQIMRQKAFKMALKVTNTRIQVTEYPCTVGIIDHINAQYPNLAEPASRVPGEQCDNILKQKMYRVQLHVPGPKWRSELDAYKHCYCLHHERVSAPRVRNGIAYPCPPALGAVIAFNRFLPNLPDVGIKIHTATAEQLHSLCTKPCALCAWCGDVVHGIPWAKSQQRKEEWVAKDENCFFD